MLHGVNKTIHSRAAAEVENVAQWDLVCEQWVREIGEQVGMGSLGKEVSVEQQSSKGAR